MLVFGASGLDASNAGRREMMLELLALVYLRAIFAVRVIAL
jgi:hypothetical protein